MVDMNGGATTRGCESLVGRTFATDGLRDLFSIVNDFEDTITVGLLEDVSS